MGLEKQANNRLSPIERKKEDKEKVEGKKSHRIVSNKQIGKGISEL